MGACCCRATIGEYDLHEVLGNGTFSQVIHGVHKSSHESFAIKMLYPGCDVCFQHEVNVLQQIRHKHIIRLIEYECEATYKQAWANFRATIMVFPLCICDLETHIVKYGRFSASASVDLIVQLLQALAYCHQHNICHRDVKPANLLISQDYQLLLADFGCANTHLQCVKHCGTKAYHAPELWERGQHTLYDGAKADIWSVGVCFLKFLSGKHPYKAVDLHDPCFRAIATRDWETFWRSLFRGSPTKPGIQLLVESMLNPDPYERLPAITLLVRFKRNFNSVSELRRRLS